MGGLQKKIKKYILDLSSYNYKINHKNMSYFELRFLLLVFYMIKINFEKQPILVNAW